MSINILLDEQKLREAPGFSDTTRTDGGGGMILDNTRIPVSVDNLGRIYITLSDHASLAPSIEPFVTEVSFFVYVSAQRTHRELGIYRHASAEGEVDLQEGRDSTQYWIKVSAKKLEDARELVRLFKIGSIRPADSFEGRQQGESKEELEARLRTVLEELESLKGENALNETNLEHTRGMLDISLDRVREVFKLSAALSNRRLKWPWCSKQKVALLINCALNREGK